MPHLQQETTGLITDWFRRARESQYVHYECGAYYSRLHYYIGIPTILLTAVVGTSVFSSLGTDGEMSGSVKIAIGLVSIAAAVLSSLQTFLSFSERAERHRVTGSGYGALRRRLECLHTLPPQNDDELRQEIEEIKETMDSLAKEAPGVPSSLKAKLDKEIKGRPHSRIFEIPAQN